MNRRTFLATSLSAACVAGRGHAAPSSPNVLIILADDLGWHDVGFHGSEIRTPSIDRLGIPGHALRSRLFVPGLHYHHFRHATERRTS